MTDKTEWVTDEMVAAAVRIAERNPNLDAPSPWTVEWYRNILRAALAAAPTPPAQEAQAGLGASSECPICGKDSPHRHDEENVHRWLEQQASRFISKPVKVISAEDYDTPCLISQGRPDGMHGAYMVASSNGEKAFVAPGTKLYLHPPNSAPTPPAQEAQPVAWRPIETAPTSGATILLWWRNAGACTGGFRIDEDWNPSKHAPESGWAGEGDGAIPCNQEDCTHWMLLPDAPSGHRYPNFAGQRAHQEILKELYGAPTLLDAARRIAELEAERDRLGQATERLLKHWPAINLDGGHDDVAFASAALGRKS